MVSEQNSASNPVEQSAYAGITVHYQAAPFYKRCFAYAIDLGVIGAIVYGLIFLFLIPIVLILSDIGIKDLKGFASNPGSFSDYRFWFILGFFLVMLLAIMLCSHSYFIYSEHKSGSTPGKKIMGLKVISQDGNRLSLRQCVGREVLRYVDCGLIIPGLLATLLSDKKQRLGDLFAGTLVTYSKALESEAQYLYLGRADFLLIQSHVRLQECSAEQKEQCVLHAFQYFIQKNGDEASHLSWLAFADALVEAPPDFPMHPKFKLFFAAELFRQKTNTQDQA